MKTWTILLKLLLINFICEINLLAQDGLHLAATITGINEQNKINYAKGIGDINGDGYADFIVAFIGYSNLYFGSTNFDTIPDYTFKSAFVVPLGDVNKDGYDDLMIGESDSNYYPPKPIFKIFSGGTKIDTIPIFEYSPPYLWDMVFSKNIEDIGDLNGDGFNDFAISSPYNWDDGRGRVYIFHGGNILDEQPAQILSSKIKKIGTSFFGSTVTGVGDINKDGYNDLLISETALDGDSGNVQLYYGGNLLDSIPDKILMSCNSFFGEHLKNAGDLNNDGSYEFIITSACGTNIYSGLDSIMTINIDVWDVGTGGDINNDNYNDFLFSNAGYKDKNDSIIGLVLVYYGAKVIDTTYSCKIYGEQQYSSFGYIPSNNAVNIAGDINQDGFDDVLIVAPAYRVNGNQVGKLYIYSYKQIDDVKENNKEVILNYKLTSNYPNPFNSETKIKYKIPLISKVTIRVYDLLGRQITTLIDDVQYPGEFNIQFNSDKYSLSNGIYFIDMNAADLNNGTSKYHKVIKTLLLK